MGFSIIFFIICTTKKFMKVFEDKFLNNSTFERVFNYLDNPGDYKWHTDNENRQVRVLEISGDWKFQFDNELPRSLGKGMEITIPKGLWHRLIPTDNSVSLRLLIKI